MTEAIIRLAQPSDAGHIARIHITTWRTTYPGSLPDRFLLNLSQPTQARRWLGLLRNKDAAHGTWVATTRNNTVIGFCSCGLQRTDLAGFTGEFFTLYLLDEARGIGLGRQMMAAMAAGMIEDGMDSAVVWVLANNPARWFYERMGGTRLAEGQSHFAGRTITEVAYGWRDIALLARQGAGSGVRR